MYWPTMGPQGDPNMEGKMSLFDEWVAWDKAHPMFWTYFEKFSEELAKKGFRHMSTTMIFERIRWETKVSMNGVLSGKMFQVPNSYRALFGRKFMLLHPEYGQFFKTMKLKAVSPEELATMKGLI